MHLTASPALRLQHPRHAEERHGSCLSSAAMCQILTAFAILCKPLRAVHLLQSEMGCARRCWSRLQVRAELPGLSR